MRERTDGDAQRRHERAIRDQFLHNVGARARCISQAESAWVSGGWEGVAAQARSVLETITGCGANALGRAHEPKARFCFSERGSRPSGSWNGCGKLNLRTSMHPHPSSCTRSDERHAHAARAAARVLLGELVVLPR